MQAIEIKQAARTALTLDSNLAEAHEALGRALMEYDWDYSGAESAYRRAIELSPQPGHRARRLFVPSDRARKPDEAVAEAGRAVALNPQSAYMLDAEGRALYRARRYREAEERYRHALSLDPGQQTSLSRLAELYIVQRRFEEAKVTLDRLERLPSLTPFRLTTPRAMLEAVSGREQEARRLVPMLSSRLSARARVYIALGDYDRAFADLESAMVNRQLPPYMFANPEMDSVRMDPRFARLLQRMGLPVDRVVALGALPIR